MRLLDMASIAHDLHDEDATTYGPTLAQHLAAAALAVAAARTHQLYGQHLAPWLAMREFTEMVRSGIRCGCAGLMCGQARMGGVGSDWYQVGDMCT